MSNPTEKLTVAMAKDLRSRLAVSEERPVVLAVYNEMKPYSDTLIPAAKSQFDMITEDDLTRPITTDYIRTKLMDVLGMVIQAPTQGGRRTSKIGKKFNKCVKSVRKSVTPRRGSTKESAAIAICTTTILHPRKRTIKRYRRGRLLTQRRKAF